MIVRAKFRVEKVTRHSGGAVGVELWPVTTGSEENKNFWKYTPSGKLEMSMTAGVPAADQFEPGQEYYLDFTLATQEVAEPG